MSKRKSPTLRKDPNVYPPGWNHQKTVEIADYYDSKKNQRVLDDVATQSDGGLVWMEVPHDLVAEIQKLITKRRKIA